MWRWFAKLSCFHVAKFFSNVLAYQMTTIVKALTQPKHLHDTPNLETPCSPSPPSCPIHLQRIHFKHKLTSSRWPRRPRLSRLGVLPRRRRRHVRVLFGPELLLSTDPQHRGLVDHERHSKHQPQAKRLRHHNQRARRRFFRTTCQNLNSNNTHTVI